MIVTAKSIVPNHEHRSDGVHLKFDNCGFFRTSKSKEIAILEKYDRRPIVTGKHDQESDGS